MPDPQANQPTLTFTCDGYSHPMRVLTLSGHEGISDLFTFAVQFACPDGEIDFSSMVGAKAHLKFLYGDTAREVNGLISRFEQGAASERFTPYFLELVPRAWVLTQRYSCRIFQEQSVPDIVKKLLGDGGVDHRFALRQSHPARTYCVQYRETDWNFIARLLEEEGIFYFFEHKDGADTLVMGDSPDAHVDIDGDATVLFRQPSQMVEEEECVFDLRYGQQIRPGQVTLRDFNFTTPDLRLNQDKKEKSASGMESKLEVYDYPGLYEADGAGSAVVKNRLEAVQTRRLEAVGQSVCRRIVPGYMFKLEDFPRRDFNGRYLITSVQHQGQQPVGEDEIGGRFVYRNTFRAIPAATPFRPTRLTPKPIVEGAQTAIVSGPSGEEIYTDKYGRVKVQFPWDREGINNEKASCWIRVSQLWAGEGWGAMFIPRIGHEVIVDFLEGDPDRPIITGRVYNAKKMPPYGLDGEKTKSTIKSNSSKGGGGFNEYRFEDKKGSEEIYQHGQKDLTIVTNNDKNQSTGHDETLKIGHDRTKTVSNDEKSDIAGNRTETVGKDETITISANRTESVGKAETISISGTRTESVGKDENITISGNRAESVSGKEDVKIGGNRSHEIGGNDSLTISGDLSEEVGGGWSSTVSKDLAFKVSGGGSMEFSKDLAQTMGGAFNAEAKDSVVISSDKDIAIKCGSAEIVLKKDGTIFIKGKDIKVDGAGKIAINAAKDMIMKGQKILQN
jgi:type VI secretion system secreted protein VgrG